MLYILLQSGADIIGPTVADVPSELSLTPPHGIKISVVVVSYLTTARVPRLCSVFDRMSIERGRANELVVDGRNQSTWKKSAKIHLCLTQIPHNLGHNPKQPGREAGD
jgi:hypothetical protein